MSGPLPVTTMVTDKLSQMSHCGQEACKMVVMLYTLVTVAVN